MRFVYCLPFLLALAACRTRQPVAALPPPARTEIRDAALIPEGIAVNPANGAVYVSSLHRRKVVQVRADGWLQELFPSGSNGFEMGLGMKVSADGKTLWICSAAPSGSGPTGLFRYDLGARRIAARYTHDSALFLNDVVLHPDGSVFVTDTYRGAVFRLPPGGSALELWSREPALSLANGIALSADGRFLFVASGDNGIQRVDIRTRSVESVSRGTRTDYAVDGLLAYGNGLIGVIGWPHDAPQQHRVIRYALTSDGYLDRATILRAADSLLQMPTTAAVRGGELLVLARTNVALFNRHNQDLERVFDSLQRSIILRLPLQ
ncbi:MAG: SMP-30/gluconolactonase/LRE family protein [Chitinophagaceae bacterium]|nr:MAG: SMP-30/gluconolactonase/LRE family protein [Chitinophagaceae bacterium]